MDYEWENCMNYELDKCMRLLSFELFIFLLEYNRGKSYPSMLLRTVCQYGLVSSFTKERTTMTCQLVKLQQIYTWALATNKLKCRLGSELIVSNLYILETNPNPTFCLNDQANSLIHFYKRCVSVTQSVTPTNNDRLGSAAHRARQTCKRLSVRLGGSYTICNKYIDEQLLLINWYIG